MPWREGLVPFRWPTTLSYKLPVLAWIVVERWITMCQLPTCFFGSPPRNLTNLPLKKRVFFVVCVKSINQGMNLQNLEVSPIAVHTSGPVWHPPGPGAQALAANVACMHQHRGVAAPGHGDGRAPWAATWWIPSTGSRYTNRKDHESLWYCWWTKSCTSW